MRAFLPWPPQAPEWLRRSAIRTVSAFKRDEMLEAVARIARVVKVPVTADLEAGYANTAARNCRICASDHGHGSGGVEL